jgi:hypothetical protein
MNIRGTEAPEEQLYLVIVSIVHYLRSRPEILTALDWIKTRLPDLKRTCAGSSNIGLQEGPPPPDGYPQIYKVITDINLETLRGQQGPKIAQWIFFMIVNTLMRSPDMGFESVNNESFRILYRFITLGFNGVNV